MAETAIHSFTPLNFIGFCKGEATTGQKLNLGKFKVVAAMFIQHQPFFRSLLLYKLVGKMINVHSKMGKASAVSSGILQML